MQMAIGTGPNSGGSGGSGGENRFGVTLLFIVLLGIACFAMAMMKRDKPSKKAEAPPAIESLRDIQTENQGQLRQADSWIIKLAVSTGVYGFDLANDADEWEWEARSIAYCCTSEHTTEHRTVRRKLVPASVFPLMTAYFKNPAEAVRKYGDDASISLEPGDRLNKTDKTVQITKEELAKKESTEAWPHTAAYSTFDVVTSAVDILKPNDVIVNMIYLDQQKNVARLGELVLRDGKIVARLSE